MRIWIAEFQIKKTRVRQVPARSPNQDLHCRHGIMFFFRIKLYIRET